MGAYFRAKFQVKPIVLKRLIRSIGLRHQDLHHLTGFGETTFGDMLNRAGYFPGKPDEIRNYCAAIKSFLKGNAQAMIWLQSHGLHVENIWEADDRPDKIGTKNSGNLPNIHSCQIPKELTISWEVEMLTPEAKKIFKLFKDPFIDDIQQESDIYMSDEHRYIEAAMLDAARHSGFLAIVGEVGSGKSVIRKKILSQLRRDNNVLVITPQMRDKKLLTASSICDSIIFDISTEIPKNRLEDKTRQVIRLLTERTNSRQRHCLLIEEAHDLSLETLKHLKRFYELEELENGFRRLLGILLIGQLEMKRKLDERSNFDAREVIRRCQIVELGPLDAAGDLEKYLSLKFKRCGIEMSNILQDDAFQAIRDRLTVLNGKNKICHLYPLLINNYMAKAMNLAAQCGQKKITAEVIYEI